MVIKVMFRILWSNYLNHSLIQGLGYKNPPKKCNQDLLQISDLKLLKFNILENFI